MKNIIILIIACLALSSCSNMESDADKVCDLTTEMMEMMPPMVKLSMKAGFGDEDSKKELDELQASLEKMSKELESIKGKYDEEEFKAYFSENCAGAKELLEMGKAFDSIGK